MFRNSALLGATAVLLVSACGIDEANGDRAAGVPRIVVTTSILGEVVRQVVGSLAQVSVIMPNGASPHDFEASAQQIAELREAGVLVVNGAGFEAGMVDVIAAATEDGVATFEAMSVIDPLEFAPDRPASPDEPAGGTGPERGTSDPHFFTDPRRMAAVVDALVAFLTAELPDLSADELAAQGTAYVAELEALDNEVDARLAAVPAQHRKVVTNHEVFAYFADRYGFEVIGTVIPGGGTQSEPDAEALAQLIEVIAAEAVPAIFADTSSPEQLAETLAAEVGDVEVVELFSESLGDDGSGAETYTDMVRTNADRIAAALGG